MMPALPILASRPEPDVPRTAHGVPRAIERRPEPTIWVVPRRHAIGCHRAPSWAICARLAAGSRAGATVTDAFLARTPAAGVPCSPPASGVLPDTPLSRRSAIAVAQLAEVERGWSSRRPLLRAPHVPHARLIGVEESDAVASSSW
jgi:hypothetical protein